MLRKNIYLLYAISLLQGMVFYGPIATLYRQAQGVSIFQITLIESISLILCLLLEIPWGILADRIGYRRTMVICCGLYLISKLVFWRASAFWAFLLERVLLSVVIAGLSGVDTSLLYLSCERGKSQRAFGIYNSMGTLGLLIAALVFSLAVGDDYRLAGGLTVVSYGAAFLLSLGLAEVRPEAARQFHWADFRSALRALFGNRALLLFLIAVALLSEAHQTITVFLNQLQYVKCGLGDAAIGVIYAFVTVAGLCGALSARLTARVGERRFGVLGYLCAFAACLALALTSSAWLSIGGILVLRLANSLFQPLQTELQNRQVRGENRATALSLNAMVVDSVGAGTNLAFGALAKRSLPGALGFGALICLVGGLMFAAVSRRLLRTESPDK